VRRVSLKKAQLHQVDFPPEVMARGFWLYVWKILAPPNKRLCYVGMTGDTGGSAQSPFIRAAGHFGTNENLNMIKRYLASHGLEPESCENFTYLVYGPIFPYQHPTPRNETYDESRRRVCALERRLWTAAKADGYTMINGCPDGGEFDQSLWDGIRAAFASHLNI
jgi:hypothetical protein